MWVFTRLIIFILVISGFYAQAAERREFFNSVRALAMGDASVAVVNDETALYLNPAALGRLRDFYGTMIDPELDMGSKVSEMRKTQMFSQPFTPDSVKSTLLENVGTYYHARGQISPSFTATNFGIGFLGKYVLDAKATSATRMDVFSQDDLGLFLGYNARLWGGRIKIGFTGKLISRIEMNETDLSTSQSLDAPTLAAANMLREGVGVGADVGMILTAPWDWLPNIAGVLRDVGGTPFDKATGVRGNPSSGRPAALTQDLDAAISISPILSNNVRSTYTLEYRGLLTAADEPDKQKLLHFGTEFNFGDVFFLRAGFNQRYWTAGFELSSEQFQFQVASYGEEVGTDVSPQEDRRYVFKFALRF